MLTLKYLLSKSLPLHRDTAPDVAIRGVKARKRRSNGNPAIVAKVQSKGYVRGTSPPKKHPIYEAIIEGMMGEGSKVSDKYVSVSCSCEYFLYNCLAGDTRVLTSEGYKTILSLTRHSKVKYVINGQTVNGSAPVCTGIKLTKALTFTNGRTMRLTHDHKVLTKAASGDDKGPFPGTFWVKAQDLKIGDKVCTDATLPPDTEPSFDNDFYDGFLCGVMMGDGTMLDGKPRIVLCGNKRSSIYPILKDAGFAFERKAINSTSDAVGLTHEALEALHLSGYKHRQSVDLKSKTFVYGYLSGLIATDGSVTKKQVNLSGGFEHLSELHYALSAMGHNRIGFLRAEKAGEVSNLAKRNADLYLLSMSSGAILELRKHLNCGKDKQAKLDALDFKPSKALGYTVIKKITRGREEHVYDISVPKLKMFVAEGVIVHNCEYALAKQGASQIRYSNGQPPVVRNPQEKPILCKHLTRLAQEVIAKGW